MELAVELKHHFSLNPILQIKKEQKTCQKKYFRLTIAKLAAHCHFGLPISMLCLPGIIGGGGTFICDGMPGFFFNDDAMRVCEDLTGCDAMLAHVVFFGCAADAVFDWLFAFDVYESR